MTKKLALGKTIQAHRLVSRLSVSQLAEKVGVSRQAIDQIERGINTPRIETLERLAAALGCEARELLP